jgi:hypothetical protein
MRPAFGKNARMTSGTSPRDPSGRDLSVHDLPRVRRRVGVLLAAPLLVLAACGGSDGDASPQAEPSSESSSESSSGSADAAGDADAGATASGGEAPIEVGEDGSIEFSDEVDEVLSSVGLDTMMGIVADQLDPSPEVSIDGDAVRFTFSEGSVDSAWLPCSVAQTFLSEGQTLTVVYPDGDTMC